MIVIIIIIISIVLIYSYNKQEKKQENDLKIDKEENIRNFKNNKVIFKVSETDNKEKQKCFLSLLKECEEKELFIPYTNISEYAAKEFEITSINKFEDLKLKVKTIQSSYNNKPCLNIILDDERLEMQMQIGSILNKDLTCFNAWASIVKNYSLWIKFEGDYKTFYDDTFTTNKVNNIKVVLLLEFLASTSEALEISSKVRTILHSKNI